ncbi:putative bifunctional diguanylate cyclase/phosphodiesterase [Actinomadura parmotrematis]|uniref:EAL domain-containing protein n=1 Tax=Actinomadura parmotrematis TaxID=2864039 RepID=A0ABS7FWZ1_9ACTN|nr:GGDEF domain-containing phosphodiesterase [Actinomadura parmotrematis]MBW8484500.1 EAL domain-containing protein [Actinomadura parmotrematis]
MSGEDGGRPPRGALAIGTAAIVGVLYAVGSVLGWGGTAFIAWAEAAAAFAATCSLLPAALGAGASAPGDEPAGDVPDAPGAAGSDPPDPAVAQDRGVGERALQRARRRVRLNQPAPGVLGAPEPDDGPDPGPRFRRGFGRRGDGPAAGESGDDTAPGAWRTPWRWFCIAAATWCLGAVGSAISATAQSRGALTLSVGDLFYLIAVVSLVLGLIVPIRPARDARTWIRYAADTYVCAAALFVLGWVSLFSDLYFRSGESAGQFGTELLYPLIDTVLVCAALPFVLGAARGERRPALMGYGALAAFAAADVITTVVRLRGGAPTDDPSDILRLAGLLLLVLAPWAGGPAADGPGRAERGRMIGPGLAVAAVAAAAALFVAGRSLTGAHGLEPVVTAVAGSAAFVLLARLAGLLRENDRLRRAVSAGEEHFRALSESINDAVLICDLDAVVQYASQGALRTYRYTADELLGRPLAEIVHPEDLPRMQAVLAEFLEAGDAAGPLKAACRVRAADGTWLPTESTVSRYAGAGDAPGRLLITTRDLSEQAALQRQVAHLTFHDGLTGLPNRAYFEERTREVLSRQVESDGGGRVAVLFADLDGFTAVNDSAGHAAGDQVLAQAARRLRGTVQADDTVARWGGDEFAVLLQLSDDGPGDSQLAVELAERLLRVLSADPYRVGSKNLALTASVGIAFAGDAEDAPRSPAENGRRLRRTAADLIRNGDLAMARAKELGGGRVEVFAPHMHADVVRRLELGSDLQRALAEEQFAVEFQPVVELATSRVTGVEALARWFRGSEAVPPEEFIAPAEESGLMVPLGDWVLRKACAEVARWRRDSWDVGLSVNFTARQIAAPTFVEAVAAALDDTGLPPSALTLEVREEVLVEDAGQNVARLSALRDLGVRLAIDDFGTGYASLAYLGQLPVDIIKIDPSFVAGLGSDETLTLLTRTIVRLGRDLGLTVVAEGIERPEQLELLREMECPRGQGYLVARPMAAGPAESLVRTNLKAQELPGRADLPLRHSALSPY